MKKKFLCRYLSFTLATLLAFLLVSCNKDEEKEEEVIDTTPISLYVGDQKSIEGATTITSDNEFVAYVKDLNVYGSHVGATTVQVNGKKTITVNVLSKNRFLCDDPICNWGCSIDYILENQKEGTLLEQKANTLSYKNAGCMTGLIYQFEDNRLKSIAALISTLYTSQFTDYLLERFVMIPYYEGENVRFVGVDALKVDDANTFVSMEVYNVNYLVVIYLPKGEQNRAVSDPQVLSKEMKEHINNFLLSCE